MQRFVNVLQPTHVCPHQHLRPPAINGFEFFVVLQGEVGIVILNENGQILRSLPRTSAARPTRAVELPECTIHTLVALAPDTVILEFPGGALRWPADKDFLAGFPAEGTVAARELVLIWEAEFNS